ncbi:serine/threonine-protein kinase [Streptomyces sp. NPDC055239]
MSNDGGPSNGAYEPTSFGLQPPQPASQQPTAQHPAGPQRPNGPQHPATQAPPPSPYAQPTQVVPNQPSEPDPGAGRLIAGRYRLLSKLGHGGMGTVWRAKDETVDREVAVKEPRIPDHLPERERANVFERMRREARAAARLDHPAVVNVHDVAVEDGQPWIVMELVKGRSLGAALHEGTLGARDAARIGLEVLGALDAAHQAGILHRDVKPDNVMLGQHDRVILTDFGIAQIEGETNLTDTGGFVGSPEFIAPERVLGQRPGPASDLWSLGVVLYAATEGVSPFRRNNTPATLQSVLNATPAAPASASGPLAQAINGLLAKDPSQRPRAGQVRALLEEAAQPPQAAPTQFVTADGVGRGGGEGSGRGSGKGVFLSRKALVVIAGVAVAAVAAGVLVALNPFGGSDAEGWKDHRSTVVAATVSAPEHYVESKPENTDTNKTWVSYTDPSGAIFITLDLAEKKDTSEEVLGSAASQAYADMEDFKASGETSFSHMSSDPAPDGTTADTKYKERKAAENTVRYTDSETEQPHEAKIFYYRTDSGNMYRLWIDYPGKGDFTERGREVAKTAIENLGIDRL